jgi:hypothetical protein
MKFSRLALVGAATLVVAQPHNHMHRHAARHGTSIDPRGASTTTTVPGPIVTIFELQGEVIPADEVEAGLAAGIYVLVGDKISTVLAAATSTTPTPTSTSTSTSTTPTPTPSSSSAEVAQFIQLTSSSTSTSATPSSSSTSAAPTTTSAPASSPVVSAESVSTSTSSSSGSGVDSDFPSGKILCSTFPSDYGAVAADWLELGGWTGIQQVPNFSTADSVISYIETAVAGSSGCTADSFCSYACPAGYQKSQWPTAQGATGQSVGGLYCNSNGYLELSRTSSTKICEPGVGNIQVINSLSTNVAICRTDYPGTESETVALNTLPGQTYEVCNPDASTYYTWEGSATSAQYYINPAGTAVSDACIWGSAGSNAGNWAPVNMGVGKSTSGETFISLFPNTPTNPDGVLNFSIEITGDVSGSCSYEGSSGTYYNNGVASSTGCTVSVTGSATFKFVNK